MKTRTSSLILAIIFLTVGILALAGLINIASAEDKVMNIKIDSTTVAMDKNGSEYVRMIVTEPRTLSGVTYQKSLPVMAFGANVETAKSYQAGDTLNAVCNYRKLPDGRESYTVISFINK